MSSTRKLDAKQTELMKPKEHQGRPAKGRGTTNCRVEGWDDEQLALIIFQLFLTCSQLFSFISRSKFPILDRHLLMKKEKKKKVNAIQIYLHDSNQIYLHDWNQIYLHDTNQI